MPPIVKHCPVCERGIFKRPTDIGIGLLLECGHIIEDNKLNNPSRVITSADGKKTLFPYQQSDLELIEQAGCRALLTYECGLGKTITSAFTVVNHIEDLKPILVIAKGAVLANWEREFNCVLGEDIIPIWLSDGKSAPVPGFPIHIISFDMVRRIKDKLLKFGFKTLIIDECQHIKDMRSSRTKAVQELAAEAKHVLALSATPIKNHAAEYFPILNILQPERFPVFESFIRNECVSYRSGYGWKIGGLLDPVGFREKTKDFIVHHTRDEVLPDLPPERRDFRFIDIENKALQKAYEETYDQFEDFMNESESKGKKGLEFYTNAMQYLAIMRHLTGLSKVEPVVERAEDFLLSTNRKLVIFHHHIDVGDMIEAKLQETLHAGGYAPALRLRGGMKPDDLDRVVEEFKSGPSRILIASTLACGEGINLQPVADAIQVERQWNSVNEEQAERRFSRPGATEKVINIDYFIAISTVDDYLTEIVERKRKLVHEAVTGEISDEMDTNVIDELIQTLIAKGKPKWRLSR